MTQQMKVKDVNLLAIWEEANALLNRFTEHLFNHVEKVIVLYRLYRFVSRYKLVGYDLITFQHICSYFNAFARMKILKLAF